MMGKLVLAVAFATALASCEVGVEATVRCHDTGTPYDAPGGKITRVAVIGGKDVVVTTFDGASRRHVLPLDRCVVEYR